MPLLWKALDHIDPMAVTLHRALWSLPVGLVILILMGRTGDILPTFRSPRRLGTLLVSTLLITVNWGIFIWAIGEARTLEAAFAYYINPLMTVAMGALFLGERFDRLQAVAIALATVAVLILGISGGVFPWISLSLAGTFAFYALLRKTVDVGPAQGFLVEVILMFPVALCGLLWLQYAHGVPALGATWNDTMLLVLAGPGTALPLILYASGAKRLALSAIGILQYMAPTIIFLIGIFVFREPTSMVQLIAFALIWLAVGLYVKSLLSRA